MAWGSTRLPHAVPFSLAPFESAELLGHCAKLAQTASYADAAQSRADLRELLRFPGCLTNAAMPSCRTDWRSSEASRSYWLPRWGSRGEAAAGAAPG
jgi:hypothetical protein